MEEEAVEEEEVRLRACVQTVRVWQGLRTIRLFVLFVPENEVCCRFCYASQCITSQSAVFMLECVQSCHYSNL